MKVNFRGDNLQGANYDNINNCGNGDAYDTLPGFLPPSDGNGGWPQAVRNYQRLNYNVVRIHQDPATPYMLDVADELGLMIQDETAIRGSNDRENFRPAPAGTTWSSTSPTWCCATATTLRLFGGARPTSPRWTSSTSSG